MSVMRASTVSPLISSAVAIAPALTIGLKGRLWTSSSTIELKASPVGSTPTWASTASRPYSARA